MPRLYIVFVLTLYLKVSGQSRELLLLSAEDQRPLAHAHVKDPESGRVWVSNSEGRVYLNGNRKELMISHIGYSSQRVSYSNLDRRDTLLMIKSVQSLEQVEVYPSDPRSILVRLMARLPAVPKRRLYTISEKFVAGDSLARLAQAQLLVSARGVNITNEKPWQKLWKVKGRNLDYLWERETGSFVSKGFIPNSSLAQLFDDRLAIHNLVIPDRLWIWEEDKGNPSRRLFNFTIKNKNGINGHAGITGKLILPLESERSIQLEYRIRTAPVSIERRSQSGEDYIQKLEEQKYKVHFEKRGKGFTLQHFQFKEFGRLCFNDSTTTYSLDLLLINHGYYIDEIKESIKLKGKAPWYSQFRSEKPSKRLWQPSGFEMRYLIK